MMDTALTPNLEPLLNIMISLSRIGFMFFFITISFRFMIYLLQKSVEIQTIENKREKTKNTEFEDNINLLEKYYKSDLNYIKQTIKDGNHPHINIIKENFENLIKLVNKKELTLTSTVDKNKIQILSTEIASIIGKYVNLIDRLNENLVEKELNDIKALNDEILDTINNFNSNKINIDDFVRNHHVSEPINELSINNLKQKINDKNFFVNYFESNGVQYEYQYEYLKKLINNDNTPYYSSIIELLYVIIEYVELLKDKEQYVQKDLKNIIKKGTKTIISNYIELLTVLDRVSELPVDNDVEVYGQLLDGIVEDVKNKKAVF